MSLPVIAAFTVSALLAAASAPLFGRLATRVGLVVAPREDRWHRRPTPLLGGAAIALGTLTALVLLLERPIEGPTLAVLVAAAGAFVLGLLDDLRRFAPTTKLVGQAMIGALLVLGGVRSEIVPFAPLAFLLTVFWVVGLMNAMNLMDNMDGLAAGIAAIAATVLALSAAGSPTAAVLSAATAGGALGFLVHNFHPARIFMGDSGSHFLGLMLAATAVLHTATSAASVGVAIAGPLLVLALPIFDTLLVMASRWWSGAPVSRGGRDHTSHRLASLGLSDRMSVLFLYAVAGGLGALGLLLTATGDLLLPLAALAIVVLALFGVFLLESGTAAPTATGPSAAARSAVLRRSSVAMRFGFEIGLDVVLLTLAYYLAYAVRFEGLPESAWMWAFTQSVPIVVGAQLAALVILGVYRTLWRYLGVADVFAIARALTLGSFAALAVIVVAFRFEGYSRAVFAMDWLMATLFLAGGRAFFLWLSHWFAARPRSGDRRVLIVGATDAGAAAVRLLTRAGDVSYRPIGFVDEDPGKRYRRIGGVRVVGRISEMEQVIKQHAVELVVVTTDDPDARQRARQACDTLGVECREFLLPI